MALKLFVNIAATSLANALVRSATDMTPIAFPQLVIGDGPEESRLRRLAATAAVPVHFVGHRPDVDRWLVLATVVAIPSISISNDAGSGTGAASRVSGAGARPVSMDSICSAW